MATVAKPANVRKPDKVVSSSGNKDAEGWGIGGNTEAETDLSTADKMSSLNV